MKPQNPASVQKSLIKTQRKIEREMSLTNLSQAPSIGQGQALLMRYIATLGDVVLPALDHLMIVVHLGGKKASDKTHASIVSSPSITTMVPPTKALPWQFQGNVDVVILLVGGDMEKRILSALKGNHQPVTFADAIIPALARQLATVTNLPGCSFDQCNDGHYCDSLTSMLLEHIVYLLMHESASRISSNAVHNAYIKNSIEYINKNLHESLNIDFLAKQANLHPSWFRKLFKQVTGVTVHRYVMHQRLDRVRDLLVNTDLTLLQIAEETGFSNQSHLTDCFKKVYGATPSKYRKIK